MESAMKYLVALLISYTTFSAFAANEPSKEETIHYINELTQINIDPANFSINTFGYIIMHWESGFNYEYNIHHVNHLLHTEDGKHYLRISCLNKKKCLRRVFGTGETTMDKGGVSTMTSMNSAEQLTKALVHLKSFYKSKNLF
jgi:hypothetical protein